MKKAGQKDPPEIDVKVSKPVFTGLDFENTP
jgi:hypothetical protein